MIRRTSTAAVLMLTARDALADRLHGLTGGADDYLIKPFAMAELVARIHAVLRRSRPGGSSISVDGSGDQRRRNAGTTRRRLPRPDRDRASTAWLPRRASGQSGEQDADLDRSLGLRRIR